ncbi:DNA binding domain, excisionase family protein [sediment metagenome]|uniref:DNA binding domain, excisionase family protein n=1 Tax=sediment metagenome TaxID=749907 RepID=D9PN57_9ZZZZ
MTDLDETRIMTIEDVAGFLRLSLRTTYQMVTDGKIPGRKIGKQWRFDRNRILEWFNDESAGNTGRKQLN